ncbi:MAG: sugar ABC transporter substrate-binding protein [Cyanobacteria bacterium SIG29]|nr:sugar ABC transporter substrate-binding protein [Cyanobacteria bacterium SIG29]
MKKFILFLIIIICSFLAILFVNKKPNEDKVSFATWGSQSEIKIIKELINDFETSTKIKVELIHIPQNYFQKIHLLFASNLEPDVIFINNHYLKMYSDANLLEDLTQYINENEYHKSAIDCLKSDNKIYAIPRDISSLVLYVNKDIVIEKNIKIKSLNELKELASKYTNEKHFGINYEELPLFWLYFLNANGGGAISDDGKSIIINKKESINALNIYSDFINKYHIAPTKAQIGSKTTAQMFINGELAFYLGGKWMMPKFKETIKFKFETIEFPSSEEKKLYVDASGWAISKKSKNKENAIKLIQFLSGEEASEKFNNSGLITPARITNQNNTFTQMLINTKPTPTNKNYGKINDILKEKGLSVLSGEKRAEEAFDTKIIRELESLL